MDRAEFEKRTDLATFFKKEDELGASPRFQAEYEKREDLEWGGMIVNRIRTEILLSLGIEPTPDVLNLLKDLRQKVREEGFGTKHGITFLKFDRSQDCLLNPGDLAPNIQLYNMDGSGVELLSFLREDRPLVVVAGSYT